MPGSLEWDGDRIAKKVRAIVDDTTWRAAESVITGCQDSVPRDTGTLARSATVTAGGLPPMDEVHEAAKVASQRTAYKGQRFSQETVVFVSYNTPYARRQHEDLEYEHRIGNAKWLENWFKANWQKLRDYIGGDLKASLRGVSKKDGDKLISGFDTGDTGGE